jgi:hypothetical protein
LRAVFESAASLYLLMLQLFFKQEAAIIKMISAGRFARSFVNLVATLLLCYFKIK